jgi:hypothetical protein
LIDQSEVPAFTKTVGRSIDVQLPGRRICGTLDRLEPQATTALSQLVLGAQAGGPLPVIRPSDHHENGMAAWQLHEPRVVGHVHLPPETLPWMAGQRGYARIRLLDESTGDRVLKSVRSWLANIERRIR